MPTNPGDPWGPVGAEVLRWLPTTAAPQSDATMAIVVIGLLFALAVLIAGFRLHRQSTPYPPSEHDSDEVPRQVGEERHG